jgi:hypothetical protein
MPKLSFNKNVSDDQRSLNDLLGQYAPEETPQISSAGIPQLPAQNVAINRNESISQLLDRYAPEKEDLGGPVDVETGGGFLERGVTSFFNTPQGKQRALEHVFGVENTRVNLNNEVEFFSPNTKKWTLLDEESVSFKDFMDIVGDLPEIVTGITGSTLGGVGGAALGGALGLPGGPGGAVAGAGKLGFAGTVAGAGLGQAAGAKIKRVIQELFGVEPEEFSFGEEFATGAGSELAAAGLLKGIKGGFGKVKSALFPGIEVPGAVQEAVDIATGEGIPLTTTQKLGAHPGVADIENFLGRFPFGGGARKIEAEGIEAFERRTMREFENKFGRFISKKKTGERIRDGLENKLKTFRLKAKELYDDVWSSLPPVPTIGGGKVVPHTYRRVAADISDEIKRTAGEISNINRFLGLASEEGLQSHGLSLPELAAVRSNLLEQSRHFSQAFPTGGKAKRLLARLNSAIDQDITEWGKQFGANTTAKLRNANKFYREEMELLTHPQVKRLLGRISTEAVEAKKIPGAIVGKEALETPQKMKQILKDIPGVWDDVRGFVAHDILESAKVLGPGDIEVLSPKKIRKVINKFDEDTLEVIFSRPQINALKETSKLGSLFQNINITSLGGNPSGTGQAVVKAGVARDVMKALGFGLGAGATTASPGAALSVTGALIIGPPIMNKILQSKPMLRYLTHQTTTKPVPRHVINAARQSLVSIINSEVKDSDKPDREEIRSQIQEIQRGN